MPKYGHVLIALCKSGLLNCFGSIRDIPSVTLSTRLAVRLRATRDLWDRQGEVSQVVVANWVHWFGSSSNIKQAFPVLIMLIIGILLLDLWPAIKTWWYLNLNSVIYEEKEEFNFLFQFSKGEKNMNSNVQQPCLMVNSFNMANTKWIYSLLHWIGLWYRSLFISFFHSHTHTHSLSPSMLCWSLMVWCCDLLLGVKWFGTGSTSTVFCRTSRRWQ